MTRVSSPPPTRAAPLRALLGLFFLLPLLALGPARAQDAPLRVVSTVGMIGDVVTRVGGACAQSTVLMGPGVDPHLYRASAGDVRTLQRADAIFYGGLSLEGQLGDVLARFAQRTPTVAVSERAVPPEARIEASGDYAVDPHVWMDASLWAETAHVIAEQIIELRPDCAEAVRERAHAFAAEAQALHGWIDEAVATVPEGRRVLVTAHDAFAYYGRAYGLEVVGVQGISTEAEAGVADVRSVAETVVARGVPALFVESTVNPRTVRAVLDAVERRGHEARLGGELYADALGEAGTPAGTYLGMLHANTEAIVTALGGELPPLPEALAPWAERWGVARNGR